MARLPHGYHDRTALTGVFFDAGFTGSKGLDTVAVQGHPRMPASRSLHADRVDGLDHQAQWVRHALLAPGRVRMADARANEVRLAFELHRRSFEELAG